MWGCSTVKTESTQPPPAVVATPEPQTKPTPVEPKPPTASNRPEPAPTVAPPPPPPAKVEPEPTVSHPPVAPPVEPKVGAATPPPVDPPEPLPTEFTSDHFVIVTTKADETAANLAARHLGDRGKAWMIEDYADASTFKAGQRVIIPRRQWNPTGVTSAGYQVVPILVYHKIATQPADRLTITDKVFAEQMEHLKRSGYRTVTARDLVEFVDGRRQLPRNAVLIAFDDGYSSFRKLAAPILKRLDFTATLFIYTDFVGGGANALSWQDLRDLMTEGFDVQPHSKSHSDLKRRRAESAEQYARRMQAELGLPLDLFRRNLADRPGPDTIAYPFGEASEELIEQVKKHGYVAGFTVVPQANPSFAAPFRVNRTQVMGDWTLDTFKKNVNVFQHEELAMPSRPEGGTSPAPAETARRPSPRAALAAEHNRLAEKLEREGHLRRALEERRVALTINARDTEAGEAEQRLERVIQEAVSGLLQDARAAAKPSSGGRKMFLTVLALDPGNREALDALRDTRQVRIMREHVVKPGETCESIAYLYWGDRSRAKVIIETNGLAAACRLNPGTRLRIPEIPGVPMLPAL